MCEIHMQKRHYIIEKCVYRFDIKRKTCSEGLLSKAFTSLSKDHIEFHIYIKQYIKLI